MKASILCIFRYFDAYYEFGLDDRAVDVKSREFFQGRL
jgi:hypothetical protein